MSHDPALGAFEPRAITGPWVVGVEAGLPVRLNPDTGQKLTLGHFGRGGTATAVIATGEAVGTLTQLNAQGQPFNVAVFWDAAGSVFPFPGPQPSTAGDLNDTVVAAVTVDNCPGRRAVRWWVAEGRWECLVSSPSTSSALTIDGQGRIFGQVNSTFVAVWEEGQPAQDYSHVGGVMAHTTDANHVIAVGDAESGGPPPFGPRAAHFLVPPSIIQLPAPAPATHRTICGAHGINAAMATVGTCDARAMLWPDTSTVIDLNTRVQAPYVLATVLGINDEGEIIGTSPEGNWLLTPLAPPAFATGECGSPVVCACGDTVVADYVIPDHLGCALGDPFEAALVVASGVEIANPGEHILWGMGEGIGILLDGAQNSRVQLHAVGFRVGVKMRAGAAMNAYHNAVTHSNREHGILITEGANSNTISVVSSVWNGISGITVDGVGWNTVQLSNVWSNPTSLALTGTQANIVWNMGLWGDSGEALRLTDAHGNNFAWDYLAQGIVVMADSPDNVFPGVGTLLLCPVVPQTNVALR